VSRASNASEFCHRDGGSDATGRNGPPDFASLCHPDDLSNAKEERASDSFAHAKPVPVSENRAASFAEGGTQRRHWRGSKEPNP